VFVGASARNSIKKIQTAYFAAFGRHGSPRLTKDIHKAGTCVSQLTVVKHMRQMGLRSKLSKCYRVNTDSSHRYTVALHLLNRDFYRQAPRVACVSGITYVPTLEGFLYLTVVLDLFDRNRSIGPSVTG